MRSSIQEYAKVSTHGVIEDANAHKLIEMLLKGALDKIHQAKGCMERSDIENKGTQISAAISIIDCLKASLNFEQGGEIAQNLDELYDYMMQTLVTANLENKTSYLDEVCQLLSTIQEGWQGIQQEAHQILTAQASKGSGNE